MKKLVALSAMVFGVAVSVFAYEPPAFGESLYELSSPQMITDGASSAGGAIYSVSPASICVNPALPAHEQRIDLNLGYTALFSGADDFHFGSAFQTGILIPTKMFVYTAYINGTFVNLPFQTKDDIAVMANNSFNFKGAVSKEITDRLSVGLGLNTGFEWTPVPDWALSLDFGAEYDFGKLSFMKDVRFGGALMNVGKCYRNSSASNILDTHEAFLTMRTGIAATLVENENIKLGSSLDISTPCFQNLIIDTGFKCSIKEMLTISLAEKINIGECARGYVNLIPSISVSFKFNFNVRNNEYLDSHEWGSSEMTVAAAYKNLFGDISAISSGVDLTLGTKDEAAPVIILWEEE